LSLLFAAPIYSVKTTLLAHLSIGSWKWERTQKKAQALLHNAVQSPYRISVREVVGNLDIVAGVGGGCEKVTIKSLLSLLFHDNIFENLL
jgi:hypothetical protein